MNEVGHVTLSRRTVVKGAAWSVPVIAAAAAVPLAAASTKLTPGVTFDDTYYGWPDTTVEDDYAKYANGVTVNVADANGNPVPDGTMVTITIGQFDSNSIWFVSNPATPIGPGGETAAPQLQTITLPTVGSKVDLDGYLRRGSDANEPGDLNQTLTATVTVNGQASSSVAYWALSSLDDHFGDDDPTPTGPKDEAQHQVIKGGWRN